MKTSLRDILGILFISSILILCANAIIFVKKNPDASYIDCIVRSIPGMLILIGFSLAGVLCKRYIPIQLPAAAYIVTIGCIMSIPGAEGSTSTVSQVMNAISGTVMKYVSEINFMSLTTPVLAYAGLSLAKDLDALKQSGWKLVVVSIFVFIGTFLGSIVIADAVLKMTGQV